MSAIIVMSLAFWLLSAKSHCTANVLTLRCTTDASEEPICGSDGSLYPTICEFHAAKQRQPKLKKSNPRLCLKYPTQIKPSLRLRRSQFYTNAFEKNQLKQIDNDISQKLGLTADLAKQFFSWFVPFVLGFLPSLMPALTRPAPSTEPPMYWPYTRRPTPPRYQRTRPRYQRTRTTFKPTTPRRRPTTPRRKPTEPRQKPSAPRRKTRTPPFETERSGVED